MARAIADIVPALGPRAWKLTGCRGTFTITNIAASTSMLPPQAADAGTGAIVKRPRVVVDDTGNESIGVRSICYLPLTYDHRLSTARRRTVPDHHQASARRRRFEAISGSGRGLNVAATVAIEARPGLIGSALVTALHTADQHVLRIVRRVPRMPVSCIGIPTR